MRPQFSFLLFAWLASWLSIPAAAEPTGIHVTGSGEVRAIPDMARVNLEVRREGEDASALKARLDEVTAGVIEMAGSMGIEKRDITAAAVSIRPRYRPSDGGTEADGLIASRLIVLVLRDLGNVGDLINGALQRGVNGIGGIELDLSNRSELERDALDLAIDDARDEALRVARRFGVTLGQVIDVSIDQHMVRPLMMEAMAARAADSGADFSPGEIRIQRNVQSTFALGTAARP
jgi:uncharacterized protein YggE